MRIDSMELAYHAFQGCRGPIPETGVLLATLIPTLEEVKESGMLVLDVPESRIEPLPSFTKQEIERSPDAERTVLAQAAKPWLDLCYFSAVQLKRLWDEDDREALRSLGYGMHNVPSLISAGGGPHASMVLPYIKVDSHHWSEFSAETRKALAREGVLKRDKLSFLRHWLRGNLR